MRRTNKNLRIERDTIRNLTTRDFTAARGGDGISVAPAASCSGCFVGCHTGDSCEKR